VAGTPGTSDPEVSVVMITYNHAHFLTAAIQSVLAQTFTDWELLVINNYSEDNTVEIVEGFADPRIHLDNFRNYGIIAASSNRGISLARGKYIGFLDSDDIWYPEKLNRCLARLSQGFDLVCHGEHWVGQGWNKRIIYGPEFRATHEALLFEKNCLSPSAVVVRREHLVSAGGFREDSEIRNAEDYDLWLRLTRAGVRVGFVPEVLGQCRIHEGNLSNAILKSMQATLQVIAYHVKLRAGQTWFDRLRLRRRKAQVYLNAARGFYHLKHYPEAWPYFILAFKYWPLLFKLYPSVVFNFFRWMAVIERKPQAQSS
jgi:glycosyltransferase involved in cell wall biosynthesis